MRSRIEGPARGLAAERRGLPGHDRLTEWRPAREAAPRAWQLGRQHMGHHGGICLVSSMDTANRILETPIDALAHYSDADNALVFMTEMS